ncbi:MAG: ATP-binding protein [Myxococcales bacterium]|nr:ATP-binding protein [Myxococcales bacterium]
MTLELPRLAVFFGPNAVGKSNILDAIQILARFGTYRTLAEAVEGREIRGYPIEQFTFPDGGLPELLGKDEQQLEFQADIEADLEIGSKTTLEAIRYKLTLAIQPRSGSLSVVDEFLARLLPSLQPRGKPSLEKVDGKLHIRKMKQGRPEQEQLRKNHTILSDPRRGGAYYPVLEAVRGALQGVRTYYLDPRISMREAVPPREVDDIGTLGQHLAPFLYRLSRTEPKCFDAAARTLRMIIPSVESLTVELDDRRGTLDLQVHQNGKNFSARMISEGTLRLLGLAAIAVNPWNARVIAFEEPENGVHLRRLDLIAQLLASLALDRGRQVIVTSHSPHFCQQILALQREAPDDIGLFIISHSGGATRCERLTAIGPLFEDSEVRRAMTARGEDGMFERMVLRGLAGG